MAFALRRPRRRSFARERRAPRGCPPRLVGPMIDRIGGGRMKTQVLLAVAGASMLLAACGTSQGAGNGASVSESTSSPDSAPRSSPAAQQGAGDAQQGAQGGSAAGESALTLTIGRVGQTGGRGVAVRDSCRDSARTGDAWPDGTEVRVFSAGLGECEGWYFVAGPSRSSWVRVEHFIEASASQSPTTAASAPPSTVTPTGVSGPTSPPSTPVGPVFGPPPVLTAPLTLAQVVEEGFLLGGDNEYLGEVSRSRSRAKSICNPSGTYGSSTSELSLHNTDSVYGHGPGGSPFNPGFNSASSAYHPDASKPPRIVWGGDVVGYVTVSSSFTSRVHPDDLLLFLGCP